MATLKHVTVIHPKFGDILNESFIDDIQFKLFLNIIHSSIEMNNDFTTYNGKDFLIHVPNVMLKECLVLGNTKEITMADVVLAKSKLEG